MPTSQSTKESIKTPQVIADELSWLDCTQKQSEPLSALCLSGGGIRSATFCLGVLQSLAQKGMLDRFHYLSTVSGGGYIGSWLSAWINRDGHGKVMSQLAETASDKEPQPLRGLRAYTNYLSPVWGLSADFLSLVATSLRNLALNWCVLIPLIAAVLLLPRLELALIHAPNLWSWPRVYFNYLLLLAAALVVMAVAYVAADLPEPPTAPPPPPGTNTAGRDKFALCCFVPLLAGAVILSWLAAWNSKAFTEAGQTWDVRMDPWMWFALAGACIHLLGVIVGTIWRWMRGLALRPDSVLDWILVMVSGAAGGASLYLAATFVPNLRDAASVELYATLSVPGLLMVFWVGGTVYAGATSSIKSEDDREWWARATAWWLGAVAVWLVGAIAVIYAPQWLLSSSWLQSPSGPQAAGVGAALAGVAASAIGYWSKNGAKIKKETESLIEATGLRLLDLLSLVFVISLVLAMSIAISCTLRLAAPGLRVEAWLAQANAADLRHAGWPPKAAATSASGPRPAISSAPVAAKAHAAYSVVLHAASVNLILFAAILLAFIGVAVSRGIGVNTFSLHSMYGNRLARAYLGASNANRRQHWFTGFDPGDNRKLADLASGPGGSPPEKRRLFHVVNVALNLVKPAGGRLEWQQRMAASFTMSPLHCGSDELGFVRTADYGATDGGLSLGRAMAISGAAASPNMGYHSSPLVAFVMTFFNVRLGWWTPNPKANSKVWQMREPVLGVKSMVDEATANTTNDTSFVYLSDGGHFENLGLYEMVRRRCKRIVVVDAGCDADYVFEDLEGAIRKARIDFGVSIEFQEPLPTPARAKANGRHIAVARVLYPGNGEGRLIYVKPVLSGAEPLDVTRYAAENGQAGKAFPHQPTSDQFFDESQFESYRMLGKYTADKHFADWDGDWFAVEAMNVPHPPSAFAPIATLSTPFDHAGLVMPRQDSIAGETLWQGAAGSLRSVSQNAMLATALTVGGVIGVTGTVGLRDNSEVALKKGAEVSLSAADKSLLTKVEARMSAAEVNALQAELKQVSETLKQVADASHSNQDAARDLADKVRSIAVRAPDTQTSASTAALAEMRTMNQQLLKVLQERPPNQVRLEELLKNANDYLMKINTAVQEIPPRRTIRPVSDGAAR
jgi:hypothetical protein